MACSEGLAGKQCDCGSCLLDGADESSGSVPARPDQRPSQDDTLQTLVRLRMKARRLSRQIAEYEAMHSETIQRYREFERRASSLLRLQANADPSFEGVEVEDYEPGTSIKVRFSVSIDFAESQHVRVIRLTELWRLLEAGAAEQV